MEMIGGGIDVFIGVRERGGDGNLVMEGGGEKRGRDRAGREWKARIGFGSSGLMNGRGRDLLSV